MPARTHRLNGDLVVPGERVRLNAEQADHGSLDRWVASFAIAVTHWPNGVPGRPATCSLLWFWQ